MSHFQDDSSIISSWFF